MLASSRIVFRAVLLFSALENGRKQEEALAGHPESSGDYIVKLENLWKRFYVYEQKPRSIKDLAVQRFKQVSRRQSVWALQGIDLEVARGRTLGVIGNNGAGKSTMLRLLSGLGRPTRGRVIVKGRVSTLLELGTGFHPDFTGRDNIYTGGLVAGLTRQEIDQRLEEIIDFAELGAVVDAPLRTYSSGMFLRLAFATIINFGPDLLVLDEALAVGDIRFQKKCTNRLLEMKQSGTTLIIVSHSMNQVEELCDDVVWMEQGKVKLYGDAEEVVRHYKERAYARNDAAPLPGANRTYAHSAPGQPEDQPTLPEVGDNPKPALKPVEIERVTLFSEFGAEVDALSSGDPLTVKLDYVAHQKVAYPIFLIGIFREDGVKCYEANTEADRVFVETVQGSGSITLTFRELALMSGRYIIHAGIYERNWNQTYDYQFSVLSFHVLGDTPGTGVFQPPHIWQA